MIAAAVNRPRSRVYKPREAGGCRRSHLEGSLMIGFRDKAVIAVLLGKQWFDVAEGSFQYQQIVRTTENNPNPK
jgi:hypothetical protein